MPRWDEVQAALIPRVRGCASMDGGHPNMPSGRASAHLKELLLVEITPCGIHSHAVSSRPPFI